MKSIRIFLSVVIISTIALVNFIATLHGYSQGMQETRRLSEDKMMQQARMLNKIINIRSDNRSFAIGSTIIVDSTLAQINDVDSVFQLFDEGNHLLVRSGNAPELPMQALKQGFSTVNFGGYRWHSLAEFDPESKTWALVAERDDIRYQLIEPVILKSIIPVIAVLPIIAVIIWFIVGLGIKPIKVLAGQIRSRGASNLSPVTLDSVPKELTLLASSTNDLLQRLEASFLREKRFNSDIAHELRTPIAAVKIHLQNLMEELEHVPEPAIKLQASINRMSYTIEQMLTLNRMAPDLYISQFSNLDLCDVLKKVIADNLDAINAKKHKLDIQADPCVVYGEHFAIETLLKNLLDNAVNYTPDGGHILIRMSTVGGEHLLQIMDDGPGIPESLYSRVFERFYRIGGDLHASGTAGCGLGLAIVNYIVEQHQARIVLGPSEYKSGLCVTVGFPVKQTI